MIVNTRENEFVTDTMALILHLEGRHMGRAARAAFEQVEAARAILYIPAMVVAEIMYLSEKGRIETTVGDVVRLLLDASQYREIPLTAALIQVASGLTTIPELHGRLIAATAVSLGVPLLTNDPVIGAEPSVMALW